MSSPLLAELSVRELAERLASSAPVPGGGSASALTGALAAALVEMVCELTTGRAEYAEVESVARQAGAAAADLRIALLAAADDDAVAYQAVVTARALPRGTDDEKAARSAAVSEAIVGATEVPLRIARLASEVLELAASMATLGNVRAVSDAGVAALVAAAALRGAALNVMINVPSLPEGHALATEAPARVAELETAAAAREGQALATVDQRLGR